MFKGYSFHYHVAVGGGICVLIQLCISTLNGVQLGKKKKLSSKPEGIIQVSEKFCPHAVHREEEMANVCNTAYSMCQWQN